MSLTPSETFKQLVLAFPMRRKSSNNLFRPFRGLGNLQATCFGLSEASETFKQLVSAFRPLGASGTPAKFAGYGLLRYPASFPAPAGAVRDACQVCRVRAFDVSGQLPSPGRGLGAASAAGEVGLVRTFEVPGQLPCPGRVPRHRLPATTPRDERVNHSKAPEPSTCEGPGASFSKQLPRPL